MRALRQAMQRLGRLCLAASARGYPLASGQQYRPFFIVGSGRSGNTLLRRILDASPQVHIPPETFVLGDVIRAFSQHRFLKWEHLVQLVLSTFEYYPEFDKFGISLRPLAVRLSQAPKKDRSLGFVLDHFYRYHAESCGKKPLVWGDKTPLNCFYLPSIKRVFPDARFIHMLRDGVDATYSYYQAGLQPTLESAARRWQRSVRAVRKFVRDNPKACMEVRYEALVGDPHRVTRRLCDFLGISYSDSLVEATSHVDGMGGVLEYRHLENVAKPITQSSVRKGRRRLSAEQLQALQGIIGSDLAELGYERADSVSGSDLT